MNPPSTLTNAPAGERATRAQTLPAMILDATRRHSGVALSSRRPGEEASVSYAELGVAVREIAAGLIALGIHPGDRVSILSGTRPEWTLADFGALCAGAVVAPIYHTNSPEECEYVLTHAGSRVVFCEDQDQLDKIDRIRARCPDLDHVVAFRGQGAGSISLAELRERGRDVEPAAVEERVAAVAPESLATIVYTSGTTGPPKGCMITHANCMATADDVRGPAEPRPTRHLHVPAARPLPRAHDPVRGDRRGRDPRLLVRRLQAGPRGAAGGSPQPLPVGAARLREDLHGRDERHRGGQPGQAVAGPLGPRPGARLPGPPPVGLDRRTASCALSTSSPTAWCSPRCAPSSAAS